MIRWSASTRPAGPVSYEGESQILVIGNTKDPATPHRNAVALHQQLGHQSVLLTVHDDGHCSYQNNDELTGDVNDYFLKNIVLQNKEYGLYNVAP